MGGVTDFSRDASPGKVKIAATANLLSKQGLPETLLRFFLS